MGGGCSSVRTYQNQASGFGISKPKPRRNKSNTSVKVNKMIPAKTPIMPVTLMTRPMMISLSAIADLPPSPCPDGPSPNRGGGVIAASCDHLVSAREQARRQVEAKPRPLNAYAYGDRDLSRIADLSGSHLQCRAKPSPSIPRGRGGGRCPKPQAAAVQRGPAGDGGDHNYVINYLCS